MNDIHKSHWHCGNLRHSNPQSFWHPFSYIIHQPKGPIHFLNFCPKQKPFWLSMHWLHGPGLLNVVEPHQTSFKTIPSLNQNPLSILVQFPLMEKIQEQQQQEEGVRFKRICVLCGTSALGKPSYQLAAVQLGKELVERNIDLVCGGSTGLMGQVAKAVSDGGRNVLEVNLRRNLKPKEITGEPVVEVNGVDAMHQRKAEMACQSDAFIALPGGYGTLEQLLEVITWAQLGIHQKPVGLLNVDGYYDSIISIIDKAVDDGFIGTAARHIVVSAPTAQQLMHDLEVYAPQHSGLVWEKEQLEYTAESDIAR